MPLYETWDENKLCNGTTMSKTYQTTLDSILGYSEKELGALYPYH